ncbi:MAG: CBS domain-containing protein [Chitinophagaceae bacterium]|nr:CBS domain-containing protein [Chitinophagaceae bacterium]MCB9047388.1 CBS domain-containing protein [Chitinophagales bacterium]
MSVTKIIAYDVPTILPDDTGDTAMRLMEENGIEHIPVVANQQYLALVKQDDMLEWDTPEQPVSASDFLRYSPAVFTEAHAYDALRLAHSQRLSVIPIVDNDNKYLGSATRETLLNYIAEGGLDNPGGVIVLEIKPLDYSLYEIVRIAESEEVSIIATQLYTHQATNTLELTIKTNRSNLESLANTYERFGYNVKELYGERSNKEDMMDRYNLLMAYINM